jgi:hypothetical protein
VFSAVVSSVDVPLLKMAEEDFEALEADQLTVQGMLASRFVKQFVEEVTAVCPVLPSHRACIVAVLSLLVRDILWCT